MFSGERLDRSLVRFLPLSKRINKVTVSQNLIDPDDLPPLNIADTYARQIEIVAQRILSARKRDAAVMLGFGAHTIKNGLGPLLVRFIEDGYVTHLATNGAGIIHDWELSYLSATSEDVRTNLENGTFGNWEETGRYLNLALLIGAYRGLGYGESIGAFVMQDGLDIPSVAELRREVMSGVQHGDEDRAAAALCVLKTIRCFGIQPGRMDLHHEWKQISVQAAAHRHKVSFTGHPMFGHDIIYTHPLNSGTAVGLCAERDFLTFAHGVTNLEGGAYISVGSAVMSPMIFEKSLSMARSIALSNGNRLGDFYIQVVDLNRSEWDWTTSGEPPQESPDYYLRFMKSFSRAGASFLSYLSMDNRDYLTALYRYLKEKTPREP